MAWSARVYDRDGVLVATLTEEQRDTFAQHVGSLNREHGWVRWEVSDV
jgi:hypothetical protein